LNGYFKQLILEAAKAHAIYTLCLLHNYCLKIGKIVFLVMQGKKKYQEKLFTDFKLSERVPPNNFYRRLKEVLDLDFLYSLTKDFYGVSKHISSSN
jgi:hypothetical protein